MSPSCVVIGAGISGLLAARELTDAGWSVIVVDKGRGVGGRMATRRVGGGNFDHGAQFFTARSDLFDGLVRGWLEAGAAAEWSRGFAGPDGERPADGHPRYRGAEGMTSVPKYLAEGLDDVRTGERVLEVARSGSGWRIGCESGLSVESDALVVSPPAPQAAELTAGVVSGHIREQLAKISYAPCFSVMLLLYEPVKLPEPGGVQVKGEVLDFIADNRIKGISERPAITIHAGPDWSRDHLEDDQDRVVATLTAAAGDFLGVDLASRTRETSVIRWLYSMVTGNYPERFLVGSNEPPLVFCGDGFGEAKVEGAALSGFAAAAWLKSRTVA
ncbi:NAD(P)/FAD-dependent oxidoreductase [Rubrobacter indicoceani]|uniref:NAD(P)/FAD-dependent oxidoreductase n=1 Tax=Rubrobacter indicoceani TaxID=2051957 RepID=UPI000E5C064C|nr:FAD-dependent oxidoreductase [Rubrobacter indicoceani]